MNEKMNEKTSKLMNKVENMLDNEKIGLYQLELIVFSLNWIDYESLAIELLEKSINSDKILVEITDFKKKNFDIINDSIVEVIDKILEIKDKEGKVSKRE